MFKNLPLAHSGSLFTLMGSIRYSSNQLPGYFCQKGLLLKCLNELKKGLKHCFCFFCCEEGNKEPQPLPVVQSSSTFLVSSCIVKCIQCCDVVTIHVSVTSKKAENTTSIKIQYSSGV